VDFLRKDSALRQWLAVLSGAVCWLALSVCLSAQPYPLGAPRHAHGFKSLADHALAAGQGVFPRLAAHGGQLQIVELCLLILLVLLLVAALLRTRRLRRKGGELERLVNERTRELEFSREQLRIQMAHDVLTGMLNRVGILGELNAEMDRTRREGGTLLVALVDVDQFKRVNDAYGYQAGDEALRWFAAAVGAAIRVYDHAGRYGGEEFLLVLTEIPRGGAAERLASLHTSISNLRIHTREAAFAITCSMGATVFDPSAGGESVESLLAAADRALYAAKTTGQNRAVLHQAQAVRRLV
jgi:diguanylate cyclase (GGDEF)-like protein